MDPKDIPKILSKQLRKEIRKEHKTECFQSLLSRLLQIRTDDYFADASEYLEKVLGVYKDNGIDGLRSSLGESGDDSVATKINMPVFESEDDIPAWLKISSPSSAGNWYTNDFNCALILMRDVGYCVYCGADLTAVGVTYDHIIPQGALKKYSKYTNSSVNVVAACASCNFKKANRGFASREELKSNSRQWYIERIRDELPKIEPYKNVTKLRARLKLESAPGLDPVTRNSNADNARAKMIDSNDVILGKPLRELVELTKRADQTRSVLAGIDNREPGEMHP